MNDPKRILIVRLSHLGDVACTLGLLHALHGAFPGARIAWAIQPEFAHLLTGVPGLERTILFDRRGGVAAWWRVRRELRRFAPDWVVDAQGNLKSAAITWLAGAERRSGMARIHWQERFGAGVLNDPAPALAPDQAKHLVQRVDGLIAHLTGALPPGLDRSPAVGQQELEQGQALLEEHFNPGSRPLLLSISRPGDVRSWPLAHWSELLHSLAQNQRPVLILQGPGEREAARQLRLERPELPNLRHWADPMELRCLTGLMAAAAQRGSRFLGVDSGPMHLAWSSGLPVTLLAGPCDAAHTGPWPLADPSHRVLRTRETLSCAPCRSGRCSQAAGNICMSGIEPADVLDQLI